MNKSSGSAVGTVIIVVGIGMLVAAVSSTSYGSVLPGFVVMWIGFAIRGQAKKRNNQPRVPQGFAPARPEQVQESSDRQPYPSAEVPAAPPVQQTPASYGSSPPAQPAYSPLPPDLSASVPRPATPSASAPAAPAAPVSDPASSAGSEGGVPVPPKVRDEVVQLANAGRTVEAIDVLREATGMELYEASQYVRKARASGR